MPYARSGAVFDNKLSGHKHSDGYQIADICVVGEEVRRFGTVLVFGSALLVGKRTEGFATSLLVMKAIFICQGHQI